METIKQILVDMRKHNGLCVSPLFIYNEDGGVNFTELIDRIGVAYYSEMKQAAELLEEYRAENARLKAALKPILDIVMDDHTSNLSMELAISVAKRIYNEQEQDK